MEVLVLKVRSCRNPVKAQNTWNCKSVADSICNCVWMVKWRRHDRCGRTIQGHFFIFFPNTLQRQVPAITIYDFTEYACSPGYIFKLGRACETGSNAHASHVQCLRYPERSSIFCLEHRSRPDTFPVWSSFTKDLDVFLQCVRLFVLPALCVS